MKMWLPLQKKEETYQFLFYIAILQEKEQQQSFQKNILKRKVPKCIYFNTHNNHRINIQTTKAWNNQSMFFLFFKLLKETKTKTNPKKQKQ